MKFMFKKIICAGLAAVMASTAAVIPASAEENAIYIRTERIPKDASEYAQDKFNSLSYSDFKAFGLNRSEAKEAYLGDGFTAKPVGIRCGTYEYYYFPIISHETIFAMLTVSYDMSEDKYSFQTDSDEMSSCLNDISTAYDNPADIYVSDNAFYAVTDNDVEIISYAPSYNLSDIDDEKDYIAEERIKEYYDKDIIISCFEDDDDIIIDEDTDMNGEAIYTPEELMDMEPDGDYYLASDIDLSEEDWKAIKGFSGSFCGNGYEISGLTSEGYGLFSSLKSGAKIKDVVMTDVCITSRFKTIGAVASIISASEKDITIENCYVSGVVASCGTKYNTSKKSTVGAIVGKNSSETTVISDCYSNAVVCSERTAGGIAGVNKGTIKGCGFGGRIENTYNIYELSTVPGEIHYDVYSYLYVLGGICGFNYGEISECFTNGSFLDIASYYGGITGVLQKGGSVTNCVSSAKVQYDDYATGGFIAGQASKNSTLENCYTRMPDESTVVSDVGSGKKNTKTYGVKDNNYDKISSFRRLKEGWEIADGVPVRSDIREYAETEPDCILYGSSLKWD